MGSAESELGSGSARPASALQTQTQRVGMKVHTGGCRV